MIKALLLDSTGHCQRGDQNLMAQWSADPESFLWIDLQDISADTEIALLEKFDLHPLAIQDAQRPRHPPKIEVFDDHLFILLRGLRAESSDLEFGTLQLSLFAGERYLITRHVEESRSINFWQSNPELPQVLASGGINLALQIAVTAAQRYLDMLLNFEPRLSELEDQLQEHPGDAAMRELTGYRTRLRKLRRIFSYHASLFEILRHTTTPTFDAHSEEYRHVVLDVYEKYERLHSLCDMYYAVAGDLIDGYISLTSHELNSTMRILTVLTAIFVPLSFLAGVYGMNFDHMPELHWRWGYFSLLGLMATIIIILLTVFKRNRWL